MVEKFTRDGMVAVLISPGFGARWSTWNSQDNEILLFDKTLGEFVMAGSDAGVVEDYINSVFLDDEVFMSGWEDVSLRWVDEGTHFIVHEYDGSEYIQVRDDVDWSVA